MSNFRRKLSLELSLFVIRLKVMVVDGARVLLLQKELDKLKTESQGWKALAKARWWYLFWIILFTILYLLRKPIMKLCLPMLR
jgi:hypothetical protein